MNIVFFGTPDFAAKILEYLIDNRINIVAVVTQAEKLRGKPSEVKLVAEKRLPNIEIFQPEKASDIEFIKKIKTFSPDLFVVVAYGKILRPDLLDVPSKDAINVHASILPKYRGAAPMQRALINGEKKTGVTIMQMAKELDAGDIIAIKEVSIDDNMNFGELHDLLCDLAKPLLLDVIQKYEQGRVKKYPQNNLLATYALKITSEDQKINFNRPADKVHNLIRGLSPLPGAFCEMEINGSLKKVKLLESDVFPFFGKAGEILKFDRDNFVIACASGAVSIKRLQIEGKKVLKVNEFILGIKSPIKIIL